MSTRPNERVAPQADDPGDTMNSGATGTVPPAAGSERHALGKDDTTAAAPAPGEARHDDDGIAVSNQ